MSSLGSSGNFGPIIVSVSFKKNTVPSNFLFLLSNCVVLGINRTAGDGFFCLLPESFSLTLEDEDEALCFEVSGTGGMELCREPILSSVGNVVSVVQCHCNGCVTLGSL